jgi:formiminotetrahydrofolate cyclodeaminase
MPLLAYDRRVAHVREVDGAARESADAVLGTRLGALLDALAAEPTARGGSAAALVVAIAARLVATAARSSRDDWDDAPGAVAQAEALRKRVAPLADADAEAYAEALEVLRPAAAGDVSGRDDTLATALERAAEVLLQIAEVGVDVAALGAVTAEEGSAQVRADAAAASVFADAGVRAATNLVTVNLGVTRDDERLTRAKKLGEAAAAASRSALARATA